MTVFFCSDFIRDLAEHGDPNFASRVLSKVVNANGGFEPDADDHRFQGADGAWIRYVSRQNTAYRAIFVRRGQDIYWYRAGGHSVEDRLRIPEHLDVAATVSDPPAGLDALTEHRHPHYTKSTHARFLREVLATRVLVAHRNITLVSPTISMELANPTELVGRLVASVLEFSGTVTTITRPPTTRTLNNYRWLASRGVDLLIHPRLNARLIYFEVDHAQLHPDLSHYRSMAVVGSAELTQRGLNINIADAEPEEELCYEIEESDLDGAYEFIMHLNDNTTDLETYVTANGLE